MGTKILYGRKVFNVLIKMRWSIFSLALSSYKNPLIAIKGLRALMKLRKNVKGNKKIKKLVLHNGSYYFGTYVPPGNSSLFKQFVIKELNKFKPTKLESNRFNNIFFAITKKCPLKCSHCFEWEQLNKKEVLEIEKIYEILDNLSEFGFNQLILSGGEPMVRIEWIYKILSHLNNKVHCWVFTSGYNLNLENAINLKNKGLKGVHISLDHYNKDFHNKFRGNENSYDWVINGVKNANKAGLLVCLSVCVTKEIANKNDLTNYMLLAKELSVGFVQFLEPKAVGHFKGKDVLLDYKQIELIEHFFKLYNTDKDYREFPIIMYHGYHQRRIGCFNAGHIGLYINTDGNINACPFCHTNGNDINLNMKEQISQITKKGCVEYGAIEL